jgi:hypothetical protein
MLPQGSDEVARMTDSDRQALPENFDTYWLLDAVDQVDELRHHLNDGEGHRPPEIRNQLLALHALAMEVVNEGAESKGQRLLDLATEIEDQVLDMMGALEKLHDTITKLITACPDSFSDEGDDEPDEADG